MAKKVQLIASAGRANRKDTLPMRNRFVETTLTLSWSLYVSIHGFRASTLGVSLHIISLELHLRSFAIMSACVILDVSIYS